MAQRSDATGTKAKGSWRTLAILGLLLTAVAAVGALPTSAAAQTAPEVNGVAYGPLPDSSSTCISRPTDPGPFPVMIYMHAGGWMAAPVVIPDFLLPQVDRAGLPLVSIDYRLVTTAAGRLVRQLFPCRTRTWTAPSGS